MHGPIVFVDFDDTLVITKLRRDAFTHFIPYDKSDETLIALGKRKAVREFFDSMTIDTQLQFWRDRGAVTFYYEDNEYVSFARPHAHEFIGACLGIAPTAIFTSGTVPFQESVFSRHKFPQIELYGRNNYDRVPPHPMHVLVDDLRHTTAGVQWKLKAFGLKAEECEYGPMIPGDRHIYIPPWDGKDKNDRELLDAIPKIKALLCR